MWLSYLIYLQLFVLCITSLNALLNMKGVVSQHLKTTARTSTSWSDPETFIMRRVYTDCQSKNDFISCLKQKALQVLTRAIKQDAIKISDGLVIERQNCTEKQSIVGTLLKARLLHSLSPIDHVLLLKADKFAQTHTLKIDLSEGSEGSEGRESKEKKKYKGDHVKYVIAALLTAMGIAGPIGLKALAAIAGKALVISKVALTIAGIIALKKLFSHDEQEETSFQLHAGEHNRRNTYVIRPVSRPNDHAFSSTYADPYRYYYEYH